MKNEWKNKWIAAGIAAVAMAVVISGVFLFLRSGRQMSVKDAYYIQNGEMVSSEGSWRLTFDKNKGTTLKGHGVRKNLTDDGTVIYYKLENKVLLPQTDCLQFAAEDKIYRLEYFSTVELVEGGGYRIKDGSNSVVKRYLPFSGTGGTDHRPGDHKASGTVHDSCRIWKCL